LGNIDKVFTKEPPRETPDESDRPLRKAKFDNFTFMENNTFLLKNDDEDNYSHNIN
jgi:hypothetical protein